MSPGETRGANSFAEGAGLTNSIAGERAEFVVTARDVEDNLRGAGNPPGVDLFTMRLTLDCTWDCQGDGWDDDDVSGTRAKDVAGRYSPRNVTFNQTEFRDLGDGRCASSSSDVYSSARRALSRRFVLFCSAPRSASRHARPLATMAPLSAI